MTQRDIWQSKSGITHHLFTYRWGKKYSIQRGVSVSNRVSRHWPYPKKATEHDQPAAASQVRWIGGEPSRSSLKRVRAGKIPTKPAARGIVPVATAVVCTTIISCGLRGLGSVLEIKNPMRAD